VKLKPSLTGLLLIVPIAIALRFWPGAENPTALFICSAIGIIPLAGWMGRATEALAARMGAGAGGLLNATFGNAAELIKRRQRLRAPPVRRADKLFPAYLMMRRRYHRQEKRREMPSPAAH
jgi:hypothetical protein